MGLCGNLSESIVEKQLYAGKVSSFPTFVTTNGNILSFLYKKSNVGIRPPISAHKYMQICQSHLAVLVSLDNSHNGMDMAKATVLGCDVLCLKRGLYDLKFY